ncbi:hypothetical protein NDU88_002828 [Pleurodeles waltl]|uniref:Uncharacterized protein n=1 Tax=Pleurodeles waltl TaxID=8319 RepID=A0AAV7RD23_PLEWA|nr:hypothetical protein NDU88_002828 [Pleurodeles waltl]
MGGAATGKSRPAPLLQDDLPGSAHGSCAPGEVKSIAPHHVGLARTRAPTPGHEEPGAARIEHPGSEAGAGPGRHGTRHSPDWRQLWILSLGR